MKHNIIDMNPTLLKQAEDRIRKDVDREVLKEMTASVREHGVLNPIEVDENNVIVTGNIRWMAAIAASIDTVPVRVLEIDSEASRIVRQLLENVQRTELPPMDIANALDRLQTLTGWNLAEIASHVHKSSAYVRRYLTMVKEPEYVQKAIAEGVVGAQSIEIANRFPVEFRERVKERLIEDRFATKDALMMMKHAVEREPEKADEIINARDYRTVRPAPNPVEEHDRAIYSALLRARQELRFVEYGQLSLITKRTLADFYHVLDEYLGSEKYKSPRSGVIEP